MKHSLVIGTRGSKLALWQAEFVSARLQIANPELHVKLEIIKTSGDQNQTASLVEIGGRGVFTKELENALLAKRIDLAVHSLKDLPTILPTELCLAAVLPREDARDALVLNQNSAVKNPSLQNLPLSAVVGTSSSRRAAQLKNLRPDVKIKDVRGNVDTRLRKLDSGDYDAILLAVAGLKRLGLENRISAFLLIEEMLPQVGQGALGLETRADDDRTNNFVTKLNDQETFWCVTAERAFLRGLGGGCQFPIAAFARILNCEMHISGLVAAPDGATILRDSIICDAANPTDNGLRLADKLLAKGAGELINLAA